MKMRRLNKGYFDMLQAPYDEPMDDWRIRVHPDDFDHVFTTYVNCHSFKDSCEFRFRTGPMDAPGEPKYIWVMAIGSPQFDDKGELILVIGFVQDITSRMNAEQHERQRAEDALAMKKQHEQFIDTVSAAWLSHQLFASRAAER